MAIFTSWREQISRHQAFLIRCLIRDTVAYGNPHSHLTFRSHRLNLLERNSRLLIDRIEALREAVRKVRRARPFHIDGWVVLPEHMHCIWTLPPGDADYPSRWRAIKIAFVKTVPCTERRSAVRIAKGERGIWQRRYWEHTIRDEVDYAAHMDYVHFNPVKHGHVTRVADWPY